MLFSIISVLLFLLTAFTLSAPLTSSQQTSPSSPNTTSSYTLKNSYTSANFFQSFTFDSSPDLTHGHVIYQTRQQASKLALAGILPNQPSSPIYLGVEHASPAPNGRPSLRMVSKQSWTHGLFILDTAHMPTGCGVWGAGWLNSLSAAWPRNGEIDIIEGVNDQDEQNLMTLHTTSECSISNSTTTAPNPFAGTITTPNCDVNAPTQGKNAGCQIAAADRKSFGPSFNAAGGGVYAVEWTSAGVAIWFFTRSSPQALALSASSLNASSPMAAAVAPDPSSWPQPQALFSGTGCDWDDHLKDMALIFDTTFCGDFAGGLWDSSKTCSKKAKTCDEFVTDHPEEFAEAFWSINGVQVWGRE